MNSKGFTITEILVTSLIVSLVILGGLSFFSYQSKYTTDAKTAKEVSETVASVLGLVASDVRKAGSGVSYLYPQLSLYASKDDLYVNWAGFLDFDAYPIADDLAVSSVFAANSWFTVSAGGFTVDNVGLTYQVPYQSAGKFVGGDFGGVIVSTAATPPVASGLPLSQAVTNLNYLYSPARTQITVATTKNTAKSNQQIQFTLPGVANNNLATPSVVYRIIRNSAADIGGRLYRNWVPVLGDATATDTVTGAHVGLRNLQVTNLWVQCRYFNPTPSPGKWITSPKDATINGTAGDWTGVGGLVYADYDMSNLKAVTVTVRYRWAPMRGGAANVATWYYSQNSVEIAPRCIYKASQEKNS
jgi:type II secretory pathway pseudopilin PulG